MKFRGQDFGYLACAIIAAVFSVFSCATLLISRVFANGESLPLGKLVLMTLLAVPAPFHPA